jgi:TPR repeat protein
MNTGNYIKSNDANSAYHYLEKACRGYDPMGCQLAGYILIAEGDGSRKKAMEHFSRACNWGLVESCFHYGYMLTKSGKIKMSAKLFENACKGGHAEACLMLANTKSIIFGTTLYDARLDKLLLDSCAYGNELSCEIYADKLIINCMNNKYDINLLSKEYYLMSCIKNNSSACNKYIIMSRTFFAQ